MNIKGKATRRDGEWILEALDGQKWKLVGGDMLPRMEGTTVRVVGVEEDNFGDSFFGGPRTLNVQKVNTI